MKLHIFKDGKLILSGNRNFTDGLWDVPFQSNKIDNINYIVTTDKNKSDLARYLHACAFSPVISTFQKCINRGNFITWPNIDNLNFKKIIDTTEATLKGHLDGERKNLRSTKAPPTNADDLINDSFPDQSEKHRTVSIYCLTH